jgi:hypothetical protein
MFSRPLSGVSSRYFNLFVFISLSLYGCGKNEASTVADAGLAAPVVAVEPVPESPEEPDEADEAPSRPRPDPQRPGNPQRPQPKPPLRPGLGAPAWGQAPERRVWANAVLGVVRSRMSELDRARDVETFCPGYRASGPAQRQNCWLLLVAAITKFESSFKPATSFREPDGNYSVGLLALSPGECPNAPTMNALKAAVPNLLCGVGKLASLVGRYGYIDGPANARGASRYWSTLRAPYKRWDPTRNRYLNLGKRNLILPLVRGYRGKTSQESVGAAVAHVEGLGYLDARAFAEHQEFERYAEIADQIAAMPVELDGYGYHNEE